MMATPHLLAGAAIGKVTRRPWLAWPCALLSHFLLDLVPHLDSHALFGVAQGGPTGPEAGVALADVFVGSLLVVLLVGRRAQRNVMLGGAFFAILIDLVDNVPPWGDWFSNWPGTAWLSEFHHGFQHNVSPADWPLGLGTQVLVAALGLWVIWPRKDKQEPLPGGSIARRRAEPEAPVSGGGYGSGCYPVSLFVASAASSNSRAS